MTSLSWNDVITQGATMGFYPDDPLSWSFLGAVGATGRGVCNNTNAITANVVSGAFNNYASAGGNSGFLKRQQYINYDTAGVNGDATYAGELTAVGCNTLWKSYISNKITGVNNTNQGVFQISIMAFIRLKHIHSFFNFVPLLKGVFMKMTLNLNNTTIAFNSAGGAGANLTLTSVSNAVGGVCPLMVASKLAGNGGAVALGTSSYRANISVGATCLDALIAGTAGVQQGQLSRSIYLYVPAYTFNPIFESAYLSSPVKAIQYTDIYQYQVLNVAAGTGQINNLLTNGIANIKSVLVLPFYSATSNTTGVAGLPVYQSPYDPAGTGCTSPLALLTNFNVVVSGQNAIYNTERYSFEQFINQTYGANAVNGGMIDGLTSGLFNQLGWEMEYCYYYVDVSRMLPVEESVPKSIQLIGTNASAQVLDLFCFIEYGVSVSIDVLTGARV